MTTIPIPQDLTTDQKNIFLQEIYKYVVENLLGGVDTKVSYNQDRSAVVFQADFDTKTIDKKLYLQLYDSVVQQRQAEEAARNETRRKIAIAFGIVNWANLSAKGKEQAADALATQLEASVITAAENWNTLTNQQKMQAQEAEFKARIIRSLM